MHSCCCIYFILWCGYICFILIDLVLENIYISEEKKEKKNKTNYSPTWRPGKPPGPACFLFSRVGRASRVFPSSASWPGGPAQLARGPDVWSSSRIFLSPLWVTDGWDPIVSLVFFKLVTEPVTIEATRSRKSWDSSRNRLIPILYRVT
jgi:hypothetical protein